MSEVSSSSISGEASVARGEALFREDLRRMQCETDRLFEKVLLLQWLACVLLAALMSSRTWIGETSQVHAHVWSAIFLGGAITTLPIWMIRIFPGAFSTRYVVAIAQMLMSGLLIGLAGGRIETHFHIFGSLVLLSFYRDWRILVPATIVVALDHFVRGIYWPYTVYGVLTASPWRSFEHAGWVVFEDIFLVISCYRSIAQMRAVAQRTAAAEASERAAHLFFEQAPIGMATVGLDDRFMQANTNLCQMLGYTEEELVRRTPFDLTHDEDLEASRQSARAMLQSNANRSVIEKRYVRKNGQLVWASRTACVIRDEAGQPQHFVFMIEDITERKRNEEELRASKHELEAAHRANQLIMDNSQDVICTCDAAGRFVTVNAACETLWGYTPAELIGSNFIQLVHPDDRRKTEQALATIFTTNRISDFVNRDMRKDGGTVDVLWSVAWSEIEQMMYCVAHDVTERARIEKELREAKEDADRANHAKSEFLSRMSHELRTPLNAILGFGQLLERQSPTETQRTRLQYIISAGRRLLNLINEVLEISRIEAGNWHLSVEPVSVSQVLHETLELIGPLADERSIDLRVATSFDSSCYVLADRQRLQQVLLNLLTNAVKYTPLRGQVELADEFCTNNTLRLNVSDTGPGIPADKIARLFTPFDRLGAEQSDVEGTGLGLALCQRLANAMGGSVGVKSAPGNGSTFWVELPLTESPFARLAQRMGGSGGRRFSKSAEARKILYIEDNLSNLTLIEQMLLDEPNVQLITAMQGRIGLQLARQHQPDLILLDLHLPDLPGWEVLDLLQKEASTSSIPVVVISADATTKQINRLRTAGARAYLTKPFDLAEFYRMLEETLNVAEDCVLA